MTRNSCYAGILICLSSTPGCRSSIKEDGTPSMMLPDAGPATGTVPDASATSTNVPTGGATHDAGAASGDATLDSGSPDASFGLELEVPAAVAAGVRFPVIVRTSDRSSLTGMVVLRAGESEVGQLMLHRGRGSVSIDLNDVGGQLLQATSGELVGEAAVLVRNMEDFNATEVGGVLSAGEHRWAAGSLTRVTEDLTLPTGSSLTIEAGALVLLDPSTNWVVSGTLIVDGTREEPVLFAASTDEPWGGVELQGAEAPVSLSHAWFSGGGGDDTRHGGHSDSQPVMRNVESTVEWQGGGIVDNRGKAFLSQRAVLRLDDVLVSRCDTGGEHQGSLVEIQNSHYLEFPDADGVAEDDDNDGTYFSAPMVVDGVDQLSSVKDTVYAMGEDDAIDHNGGQVLIERTWIEGFAHEGIAASNQRSITIRDSVIKGCAQGVESGYGSPMVTVERSVITENGVGLRFGDDYSDDPVGTLRVAESAVVFNDLDVLESDDEIDVTGKIELECTLVSDAEWATGSNLDVAPEWDFEDCGGYPVPDGCDRPGPSAAVCETW